MPHPTYRLAAILFTDISGYTAVMQREEAAAVRLIRRHQEVLEATVKAHHGEVTQYYGDGSLSLLPSATEAVQCALELQRQFREEPKVPLRIGIHIGEIRSEGEQIFGDGVNIASRIESMGVAGAVLFSREVYEKIRNRPEFTAVSLGLFEFKHVEYPMEVFALANPGLEIPPDSGGEGAKGMPVERRRTALRWPWVLALIALTTLLSVWVTRRTQPGSEATGKTTHAHFVFPEAAPLYLGYMQRTIALSPDGSLLAYIGQDSLARRIYLRKMDAFEVEALPGTENADYLFFSPDGQWMGFYAGGKILKVSMAGGKPSALCNANWHYGAVWGPDDRIYFSDSEGEALSWVSAAGGDVTYMESRGNWPALLPGGRQLLLADQNMLLVVDIANGEEKRLKLPGVTPPIGHPTYLPGGHIVFGQFGRLLAVPFDLDKLELTGLPAPVMENLHTSFAQGATQFFAAPDGTLLFVPGHSATEGQLMWLDRQGNTEYLPFPSANYGTFQLSPDGRRIAVEVFDVNAHIFLLDLQQESTAKLTQAGNNLSPVWSPDGRSVVFSSDRDGDWNLFRKEINGGVSAEALIAAEKAGAFLRPKPNSFTPGGEYLIFEASRPGKKRDIWRLPLQPPGDPELLIGTPYNEWGGRLSPNGQYLAYNEAGYREDSDVVIQPYPPDGRRWQLSDGGGEMPLWPADGQRLFFRDPYVEKVFGVNLSYEPAFSTGTPVEILDRNTLDIDGCDWTLAADGRRFLVLDPVHRERTAGYLGIVRRWEVR